MNAGCCLSHLQANRTTWEGNARVQENTFRPMGLCMVRGPQIERASSSCISDIKEEALQIAQPRIWPGRHSTPCKTWLSGFLEIFSSSRHSKDMSRETADLSPRSGWRFLAVLMCQGFRQRTVPSVRRIYLLFRFCRTPRDSCQPVSSSNL